MANDEIDEMEDFEDMEEEQLTEREGVKMKHGEKGPHMSIWKRVMRGDMLGGKMLKDQAWWIVMIVVCLMVIVTMRYRVEDLQKEKMATEERIKVLREERLQMQKQYQESVKISRIEEELDTLGIGLISGPPYAI